jgi:hypothetical protein
LNTCEILLTTPSHIERILLHPQFNALVRRLKYVILDEIHCMGSEDGELWERALVMLPCPFVALSATISDPKALADWLNQIHKMKLKRWISQKIETMRTLSARTQVADSWERKRNGEIWWESLNPEQRSEMLCFLANANSEHPGQPQNVKVACITGFQLQDYQYEWLLFEDQVAAAMQQNGFSAQEPLAPVSLIDFYSRWSHLDAKFYCPSKDLSENTAQHVSEPIKAPSAASSKAPSATPSVLPSAEASKLLDIHPLFALWNNQRYDKVKKLDSATLKSLSFSPVDSLVLHRQMLAALKVVNDKDSRGEFNDVGKEKLRKEEKEIRALTPEYYFRPRVDHQSYEEFIADPDRRARPSLLKTDVKNWTDCLKQKLIDWSETCEVAPAGVSSLLLNTTLEKTVGPFQNEISRLKEADALQYDTASLKDNMLDLLQLLQRQDMLPAIVFTNSRDSVDSILTEVTTSLEIAENKERLVRYSKEREVEQRQRVAKVKKELEDIKAAIEKKNRPDPELQKKYESKRSELQATEDEIEADTQGYHCSDRRFALGLTLTNIFSKL